MTENIDPRLHYRAALAWIRALTDGTAVDRLTALPRSARSALRDKR